MLTRPLFGFLNPTSPGCNVPCIDDRNWLALAPNQLRAYSIDLHVKLPGEEAADFAESATNLFAGDDWKSDAAQDEVTKVTEILSLRHPSGSL